MTLPVSNSRRSALRPVATFSLGLAVLCSWGCWGADSVEFRFAPPIGFVGEENSKYKETLRTDLFSRSRGSMKTLRAEAEIRSDLSIQDGENWQVSFVSRPRQAVLNLNGYEVGPGHPFVKALLKATLIRDVWDEGRFAGVRGYDKLSLRLLSTLDEDDFDLLGIPMSTRKAEQAEEAAWRGRVETLLGWATEVGGSSTEEAICIVPGGSVSCIEKIEVVELRDHAGKLCALLRLDYTLDPSSASARLVPQEGGPMGRQRIGADVQVTELHATGERLVEPETLMVFRDRLQQKTKLSVGNRRLEYQIEQSYDLVPKSR